MKKIASLVVILFCFGVLGCTSSVGTLQRVENAADIYSHTNVPVNVFLDVDAFRKERITKYEYEENQFLRGTFLEAMFGEGAFSGVAVGKREYAHSVGVKYRTKIVGGFSSNVATAMLTGLTLGLIPAMQEIEHVVDFEVYDGTSLIASYSYTDIRKTTNRFKFEQQEEQRDVIENLVEHFLEDINKDRVLLP